MFNGLMHRKEASLQHPPVDRLSELSLPLSQRSVLKNSLLLIWYVFRLLILVLRRLELLPLSPWPPCLSLHWLPFARKAPISQLLTTLRLERLTAGRT